MCFDNDFCFFNFDNFMIDTRNSNSVVMMLIFIDEWLCQIVYPVDVPAVEPEVSAGSEVDLLCAVDTFL